MCVPVWGWVPSSYPVHLILSWKQLIYTPLTHYIWLYFSTCFVGTSIGITPLNQVSYVETNSGYNCILLIVSGSSFFRWIIMSSSPSPCNLLQGIQHSFSVYSYPWRSSCKDRICLILYGCSCMYPCISFGYLWLYPFNWCCKIPPALFYTYFTL